MALAPDRAASVEMAIANLMMKYRDLMRTPGKSKTEKERDFIMLMRDKFLGMEGQPNCSLLRPINHVLSLTPNLQYSLSTDHYLLTIHSLLHSHYLVIIGPTDDIILSEKNVNLLRGIYPMQGKFKKKNDWIEMDEPGVKTSRNNQSTP